MRLVRTQRTLLPSAVPAFLAAAAALVGLPPSASPVLAQAARWEVETDRGYRVFDIRDREDLRLIGGTRVLLQDADGNRFEIEDIGELDDRSRRLLEAEI